MDDRPDEIAPALTGAKLAATFGVLLAAAAAVAVACSLVGIVELNRQIWQMRLARLGAGAVVGAGLAAAGMALQALLRNPLAEPYVLGVSSGAGVGVLAGVALTGSGGALTSAITGTGWAVTPLLALAGALATCAVVYGIAQRRGRLDPYVLLLSGVIVNVFNGAIMLAILLVIDRPKVLDFVSWSMGRMPDLAGAGPLATCTAAVAAGWTLLLLRGAALNALGLGDEVAASSGVAVHRLRVEVFAAVAVMSAAAVSLAGPVGFVGLIVPHVCRLIVGPDHRRLVIVSGFAGAILLMVADTVCRTVGYHLSQGEIPVGILTALCGGPFFICLLRRRLREAAP